MSKDKICSSKVLVTGGAGFIGSHLIETLLGQDNRVVCLDNFSTGKRENIKPFLKHPNFKLIDGDIVQIDMCREAVYGIDYVLHQAALGSVPRSIKDPLQTNLVNISGFLNVLQASVEAKVKRFVYAASSSTYGDHSSLPKVENHIGNPLSPYAVTKYVNELYAKVFADIYGIEVIGLRYFNVFGVRQDPHGAYAAVIPKFIDALMNKKPPTIYGDGQTSRDFTYIDNVVQANQLAALVSDTQALNTVYNIAYGQRTSLNEMFDVIKDSLMSYGISVADIHAVYAAERIGDVKHSLADISKAKRLLGYAPTSSFQDGIRQTLEAITRKP